MASEGTIIAPDDPRLSWPGSVSLERRDGWVQPWRLPETERGLFHEPMHLAAAKPAGVRLAFRTSAARLTVRVSPIPEPEQGLDPGRLDLCCDGEVACSLPIDHGESYRFEGLPAGAKAVEFWLSPRSRFRLRALELDAGASIERLEDDRPRWIAYGSSITQSGAGASPTQTWPGIVARGRGMNLTNLGFGGQCHLDAMVARMIRSLPADLISLCVGINIYGGSSLGPRAFRPAIIGFVKIVREGHPDAPLTVMSPIASPPREGTKNAVGFTLPAMREEVALAVEALRAHGDRNVHYVNGLDILGPEFAHLLPDGVHPDAEGYRVLGRNFLERVVRKAFP